MRPITNELVSSVFQMPRMGRHLSTLYDAALQFIASLSWRLSLCWLTVLVFRLRSKSSMHLHLLQRLLPCVDH